MARAIKRLPITSVRRAKISKYGLYADGRMWQIRQSDHAMPLRSIRSSLHSLARSRGQHVVTRLRDGILFVQFFSPEPEDEPDGAVRHETGEGVGE